MFTSVGQQKGVNSLIVTDLIELARQKAICDAVLISGDEDVRVGVQMARNYGVRVHLLGIEPSRANQSQQFLHEADTTTEWPTETVGRFLALRPQKEHKAVSEPAVDRARDQSAGQLCEDHRLEAEVRLLVEALEATELEAIRVYWRTDRGVPSECGSTVTKIHAPSELRFFHHWYADAPLMRRSIDVGAVSLVHSFAF